jgi:hypothetical protein
MTATATLPVTTSWSQENHGYVLAELERVRLRLRRRALWLRSRWATQTAADREGLAVSHAQADRLMAGEDPLAEARFYGRDPEAVQAGRLLAAAEAELSRRRARMRAAGKVPTLESLARLFDLTELERETVLLCLAPQLDASFERLYAYVQDDAGRPYVTPALVCSLFPGPVSEDPLPWHSFQPHAPLRRFRLVTMGETGTLASSPLALADRVVAYLLGFSRIDERVAELVGTPPAVPLPASLEDQAQALARWAGAGLARGAWPRLNLTGAAGSGRLALAQRVCANLRLTLHALDARRLAAAPPEVPALLEREAVLSQCAFHVDTTEWDAAGDAGLFRSLEDWVRRLRVLLILASVEPWSGDGHVLCVAVRRPSAPEQVRLWQEALPEVAEGGEGLAAVVEQFDLGPTTIADSAVRALENARVRDGADTPVTLKDIREACRSRAGTGARGLARPLECLHGWEDLVLPPTGCEQLREIADQVENRARVYVGWGFGQRLGRGCGISALFSGPSGTGKTMAASVLARHLDLELYRVDLSTVVSKYVGETEKNLRHVFDAAEQSGAILFFDEADALFGKRTEVRDSHDRYANIEIDYLLQRMEEYRGLAVLATNVKSHMDQAFLRRLRFVVEFPFPDVQQRRLIWQKVFPTGVPLEPLRFDLLARLEVPGGNIRNIALNATFLAAKERAAVSMDHVMRAAVREYTKEGRLLTAAEFGPYQPGSRS